jgi:AraC-like DNA-binding protein
MPEPGYVEHAPSGPLAGVLLREWQRSATAGSEVLVVPDGCADIMWRSDGSLLVAGPNLGPITHHQAPDVYFVGLRLLPGAGGAVLGHELDGLREQLVPLSSLWGRGADLVAEQLAATSSLREQRSILAGMLVRRVDSVAVDREVVATARALATSSVSVSSVSEQVGLSDRQLQRRFIRQVGYGPKTFQRIMRFRRAVATHEHSSRTQPDRQLGLAELATAAGYADQAHLTRECRRLTGLTPASFLARSQPHDPALVREVGFVHDGHEGPGEPLSA